MKKHKIILIKILLTASSSMLLPCWPFSNNKNEPDSISHQSELISAIKQNNYPKVKELICSTYNLDINKKDEAGNTPLLLSITPEGEQIALFLLRHGADPDQINHNGFAPIHKAAEQNFYKVFVLLKDKKANMNKYTTNEQQAIDIIRSKYPDKEDIFKKVIDADEDTFERIYKALFGFTCACGAFQCCSCRCDSCYD